GFKNNIHS
ncbi:putative branched-chain amino acid transport domain protein, partial [Chlamydia psittaci C1/97]